MATLSPPYDPEGATAYAPIPAGPPVEHRRSKKLLFPIIYFSSFLLLSVILLIINQGQDPSPQVEINHKPSHFSPAETRSRGAAQGVSEKVFRPASGGLGSSFSWTNDMLSWQRTSYHFQPVNNWMNDPNGPLFYKGWYHFFYQYNPKLPVWGTIIWGHAASRDLIHWFHLPYAMEPDQPCDVNGVWTGSATILPNGEIVMLYTSGTADLVQVQNLAYPANLSDPLLLKWDKYPGNPVLVPPPGIGKKDFRDPTTAWLSPDGKKWRFVIGSKDANKASIAIVYETVDFKKYKLLDGYLHAVSGTGMWECIDFYPVSLTETNGLDTSVNGPGVKHLMKTSLDDDNHDYYALGTYDPYNNKWTPDNPELDVGIGLRYDYGTYYASKTFYDQNKQRRILWGWTKETDAEDLDLSKGWAGLQCIPRTIVFDEKTGTNILQWPVEEVESLRSDSYEFDNVKLGPGSIAPLKVKSASQLDIVATFEIDSVALETLAEADSSYNCPTSGGAATRGKVGPFGIVVFADETRTESTPVYFYVAKGANGKAETHFCADELRSSVASDVDKIVYGSTVPVLDGEKYSIRALVDHSIVESFAQGGRTVITSRIYPTKAIDGAARVFVFNNATGVSVTASVKIWEMKSADIRQFPADQLNA